MLCKENGPAPVPAKLNDAILNTENWRRFYATCFNRIDTPESSPIHPDGEQVYRGFRVPLSDLRGIVNIIEEYNNDPVNQEKINSIRIYLASKNPYPEQTTNEDLHVYLVPVKGGEEIHNAIPVGQYGSDLLSYQEESTIFDFSTPCPSQCDPGSTLYKSR